MKEMKQSGKTAIVGFDGAVDTRVRVRHKTGEDAGYFASLADFGRSLAAHEGKNCSFELERISEHFGGNAPLIANALQAMGTETVCIGTMGLKDLHPAFQETGAKLISYGDPASTLALEFEDGKTFLEENPDLPDAWEKIRTAVSEKTETDVASFFQNADLLAFVNWSELPYAGKLWKKLSADCFSGEKTDCSKFMFFDLCDISRRTVAECRGVLSQIAEFSKKRFTVLGLNQNETEVLGEILGYGSEPDRICRNLQDLYGIAEVLMHTRTENRLYTENGRSVSRKVCLVEKPAVLTGAGDHFSAAYCQSLLLGMDAVERLRFATEYAENYVRTGKA